MGNPLPTSSNDAVVCNLSVFPGRDAKLETIAYESLHVQHSLPPISIIEAAWCITLHLYSGLDHVCFEARGENGPAITKIVKVEKNDDLRRIVSRLKQNEDQERQHHYNTAVILDSAHQADVLWPGIQIALHVTHSKLGLLFRQNFMSSEEAKNVGATFSYVLADAIASGATAKIVRDFSLSQQDLDSIVRWNSNELISKEAIVHEQFSRVAHMQPAAEAIDAWDGRMTYQDLDRASDTLGCHLRRMGVVPGSWVLFCFNKSRWAVIAMLAVLKAGAACAPLDPRHPELRIRQIIQTTRAKHALVGADDTSALLSRSDPEIQVIDVTQVQESSSVDGREADPPKVTPDSPAIGVFTSGSTGVPKGIVATHAAVCTTMESLMSLMGGGSKTRILQFSSYTFDISMGDMFGALLHGATLCIPSEEDRMGGLQEYILHTRPTWANLTPTVARLLEPTVVKQSLTKLLLAGEPVKEADVEDWIDAGVEVYNVYGPAENLIFSTAARTVKGRASNIGYGAVTRTWVADVDKQRLVPIGAVGELIVEGPRVAPGYLNDPERTKTSFFSKPDWIPAVPSNSSTARHFYRTGDLVQQNADGSLQCIGRADTQVKLGGQRVELSDIESHIQMHRAAVLLPKAGPLSNRLTAVLQISKAQAIEPSVSFTRLEPSLVTSVSSELSQNVPAYMIPTSWLGIGELPFSASGKLDRKTLIARLEGLSHEDHSRLVGTETAASDDGSELNEQQKLLRRVCSQVLNLPYEKILMTRSFAGLGGDSITAMQVSSTIRRVGRKMIPVKALLSCPSLLDAAARITDLPSSQISVPVIQPGKRFALSPIQRFFVDTAAPSSAWNHYNQNVLLRLAEPREAQKVELAIAGVLSRHAMLRTRFERLPSGEWMQYIVSEIDNDFRLDFHPDVTTQEGQKEAMKQARESLSITDGPVIRAQLFGETRGNGMLLFIVAHHIIVDLVSWRIIIEELEASLANALGKPDQEMSQLLASSQQSLPFFAWTELQLQTCQQVRPSQTIPERPELPDPDFSYWGILPHQNVYADVKEFRMSLSETTTNHLLYDCHRALQTEPVDVLLAAVMLSFKRAFSERELPPIMNEGHGREPWDNQIDVSRTVGWFTTMYPIYVAEINDGDVTGLARRVKDWRKTVPSNGFQYFSSKYLNEEGRAAFKKHLPAEILFNYEGRYQALEKEDSLLKPESWTAGEELADMGPTLQRFCLFELSAAILADGKLHFTGAWNTRTKHQERIALWLETLLPAAIEEVVASLIVERRQFTLYDLGKTDLSDYSEVDTLTESVLHVPGIKSIDDVEDVYYGSPMQDSLALSQSKAGMDAYEIDFTWEVEANPASGLAHPIDPERLAVAWRETVARHPTLRTIFLEATTTAGGGMLHQVILNKHEPCYISLQANNTRQALERLASYQSYRDQSLFDDKRPPHRLLICQTDEGKTFVRFQVNHILFDGMSTVPLFRDISGAYKEGVQKALSDRRLPAPFADFIRYIRDPVRRAESIDYWKSYLTGAKPCLFPTLIDAKPIEPVPGQGPERGSVSVPLEVEFSKLHQRLAELGVTIPSIVQLAWAMVLRLYTADTQSVFGYLASGRDAPVDGIDDAVGPFLAMLVCYVDFERDQDLSVPDMLKKIQESSANSIDHQGSSLAEIQSALNLPGNSLLFNSGISFLPKITKQMQKEQESALIFEEVTSNDPTEFDLSLHVEIDEHDAKISMRLDYLESAISSGHTANIANTLNYVLSELVRDPFRRPDEISGMSKSDTDTIWKWNKDLIAPLEKCAHDIFIERVLAHPDKEAIYSWDGSMTYKELDDASRRLGKYFVQLGVGPEKMVPVCFEKSRWTIVAILAIIKAGGCFVLLDPALPEARLWTIMNEIEASVLVCSPLTNHSKKLGETAAKSDRAITTVEIGPDFLDGLPPLDGNERPDTPICDSVGPDNAVYVVFTSGTTGTPKGTIITHRALATGLHEHAVATGMTSIQPEVRSLQFASYSFDASIGDIFTTIEAGGTICVPSEGERSPADIMAFIARSRASWAGITPSFASLLDPEAVPTLQAMCMAGEPLPASQVDAWVDRLQLINMYGPSECTIACVANPEVTRQTAASNIGRGYRAVTWIVDENDHERLRPIGTIGELLIEGPVLSRGYLKRPKQTAEVFIDSPSWLKPVRPYSKLYKTGDLVRYNSDGTISFIGRKDTQIKINGQRVEIGEIETVLRSSLDRSEGPIVVDLLKRASLGEADLLVAFVCVGSEKKDVDKSEDIIATSQESLAKFHAIAAKILDPRAATSSLPRYMMPHAYIPLEKLPLTTSGKIDRRTLQQEAAHFNRAELVAFTSAFTAVVDDVLETKYELLLSKLWESVLHVEARGKHSNFYRLGGDSMAAMALRAEARRAGLSLSVADIFANPDLVDMAKVLASASTSDSDSSAVSTSSDSTSLSTPSENDQDVEPFSLLQGLDILQIDEFLEDVSRECGISSRDIEDIFPCAPMQEGLMALSSSESRKGAYALHAAFKLPVGLDRSRFQLAWEQTVSLHPILRSRIVLRPQGSLVVVTRSAADVYYASGSSIEEHLETQRSQLFHYGSPLFRLGLVQDVNDNSDYLIMSAHHSTYDGWSMKLIWDTALELYQKESSEPLRGPSFQAFVRQLSLAQQASSEKYWRDALAEHDQDGFQFPLVPGSHKPIARSTSTFQFSYNPEAAKSLAVTSADLINAAWGITLSQYSASSTVVFGVTLSGRDFPMPGVDQLVGPTIATVPRQLDIKHDQSVSDFLRYVQRVATATLPHQHLGLQRIQSLGPAAQRACDFTSLLVVHPGSTGVPSAMGGVGIVPVPIDGADFHPYPLAVECSPEGKTLTVQVAFDPECIDETMIGYVMQQFNHILQNLSQPASPSSSSKNVGKLIAELAPTHLDTIVDWNLKSNNFTNPAQTRCVHHLIEEVASERASDPAIVSHDASLSYAEMVQLANTLSHQILKLSQDYLDVPFIALCVDKSAAAVISMLAILKAGFAFMPLNPGQPTARLESLLGAAGTKVILASPNHKQALSSLSAERHVLSVDLALLKEEQPQELDNRVVGTDPSRAAYLLYTSGTTGKPKAVVMEHGAWSCAMASQSDFFNLNSETRMLQFSSYMFDVSIFEIFATLISGGSVWVPSEYERVNDLENFIRSHNINSLALTPTVARLLDADDLPDVRLMAFAGETLAQSDIEAWTRPGRRIVNAYGPTETCIYVSGRNILPGSGRKNSSNIGYGMGAAMWVVNPATDTLSPIGAVGELCIGGPNLARGYHGDKERTDQSFPSQLLDGISAWKHDKRVYHSGDLVRYDANGTLEYLCRQDGQVKLRGQRIDVGEIEHHIRQSMLDKIEFRYSKVHLYKPESGSTEPLLVAFLVMDLPFDHEILGVPCSYLTTGGEDYPASLVNELRRKLRSILPDYMVPSAFIALERLPTAVSGKLDPQFIDMCLRDMPTKPRDDQSHVASRELTPDEQLVAEWWARVLGVDLDSIRPDSDFFAHGANSISAIKLVSLARSAGRKIRYEDIFSSPTLSDLAASLSKGSRDIKSSRTSLDVKPFELLAQGELDAISKHTLPRYGINVNEVDDIYPCTPFQSYGMELTANRRGAFTLIATIDVSVSQLHQLKDSWALTFRKFELLRTRIIPSNRYGMLQVVLKDSVLEWKEVPDVDTFTNFVYDTHGFGEPLVRLGVTNPKSSTQSTIQSGDQTVDKVTVIFSIHHSAFDGWALTPIWRRLFLEPFVVRSSDDLQVTPFRNFIRYLISQDSDVAKAFWRKRLAGLANSEFPIRASTIPEGHRPMISKVRRQRITLPAPEVQRRLGATAATVTQAAWALTISHYTGNSDTIFRMMLSGRDSEAANVPGIENIAGPATTSVPCRTIVDLSSDVSSFLGAIQRDNVQVARHAHIGIKQIYQASEDYRRTVGQLDTVFNVPAVESDDPSDGPSGTFAPEINDMDNYSPDSIVVDVEPIKGGREMIVMLSYDPIIVPETQSQQILDTYSSILQKLFQASATAPLRDILA